MKGIISLKTMYENRKSIYECMFVITTALSKEGYNKVIDRIQGLILENKGIIIKSHDLGVKRLAYRIKDCKDASYYLLYFEMYNIKISEIRDSYRLDEDIIRFLLIRIKKKQIMEKISFNTTEITN